MPKLKVEGIDLSVGIEDHPDLICIAIVVNGEVIPTGDSTDQTKEQQFAEKEDTDSCT